MSKELTLDFLSVKHNKHCLLYLFIFFLSINRHVGKCRIPKIKSKIENYCMRKYNVIKNILVASFAMGQKRRSGVIHNKNSKTYKTTDRQSASKALSFFIEYCQHFLSKVVNILYSSLFRC